jgi:class 3 adenylate cyclase
MPRPQWKNFLDPHQIRKFPNGQIETVTLHENTIGRFVMQPGWHWSRDVSPIVGTRSCQVHHVGVVVKGRLHLKTDAGEEFEFGVGDVYDIPPGHDAWVEGDEVFEGIEFAGARIFAAPADGERVLAAMLVTDIVDSTAQLKRLGDTAWRELLMDHNHQARVEINRFRGREIQTTGDGFLAVFDGPARAVRCGQAIGESVSRLGLAVRAGVHTGEVEFLGDNVRGLAVHEAARVANAASAGNVFVSATTKILLTGSDLAFESVGMHELKGLGEARELFKVLGN